MFFIPGWLVALATFPGVIVHEAGHLLFCRWFKLAVHDVCFFRLGNPAGYVIHEFRDDFKAIFFVGMGPFFVNTALCVVFCSAAFLPVWELEVTDPFAYFFYWLGLSIGMHAIPSTVDLKAIWRLAPRAAGRGNILAIVSLPVGGLLYVLNFARVFWADLGSGLAGGVLAEGEKVFICGRDAAHLKAALEGLGQRHSGDRVDGIVADVRRYEDCRWLIERASERFGGLDILVNNAGIGVFKPVDQLTPEDWDATIGTNLSGAFYCCREAIPQMRKRGGGYIFNISSLAGVNPFAGGTAYNASKFGLNGFSEAMMQDVRYDGIRVSYIMPGSVATEFNPAPQFRDPNLGWKLTGEDIAKAVVDLYRYPKTALASRVELRPSQPPRKK